MMSSDQNIENKLNCIVGSPLQYGIKSSDLDLFQLGFGESISLECWEDQSLEINKYAIHFDSALYVYWETGKVDKLYSNIQEDEFNMVISKLVGKLVKRIALSTKNDLWIDLGDCKIVVVTRDDEEESWRFFLPRTHHPHLIATSTTLMLDVD